MVTRTVLDGKTLGVEYALTPLGKSLESPFNALYDCCLLYTSRCV